VLALLAWGNRHFAPEGSSVILVNRDNGAPVDPILADPATGRPVDDLHYALVPGPAANDRVLEKYRTAVKAPTARNGTRRRRAAQRVGANDANLLVGNPKPAI
jgi:hypothetical protein